MDAIARPNTGMQLVMESSTPGVVEMSVGGVGGNIARALAVLGAPPLLVSAVGHDSGGSSFVTSQGSLSLNLTLIEGGELIRKITGELGMEGGGLIASPKSATYHAILDEKGDLTAAIADMEIFNTVRPEVLVPFKVLALVVTPIQTLSEPW